MKVLFIALMLTFPFGVFAEEKGAGEVKPEDVVQGSIKVKTNAEYTKPYVDGAVWDEHEFEDDGKTLLIYKVNRKKEVTIKLEPVMNPLLGEVTFKVKPKQWKLKRIKAGVREWRYEKKVKFREKKAK